MLAEDRVIEHPDNIVFIILIFLLEVPEQVQLYAGLVLESLLISDDFDGNDHLQLMIEAL